MRRLHLRLYVTIVGTLVAFAVSAAILWHVVAWPQGAAWGLERDELYVVTKVDPEEDSYSAIRKNLAQLKLNYVDLALIHRPPARGPGEKIWQGLRRAKREGLVHDIGVSSYSIECIEELVYLTGEMPAVNQIEWTPFGHSPRMISTYWIEKPIARRLRRRLAPQQPLAQGVTIT